MRQGKRDEQFVNLGAVEVHAQGVPESRQAYTIAKSTFWLDVQIELQALTLVEVEGWVLVHLQMPCRF